MRLEQYLSDKNIDEELLFRQARGFSDAILGENTWLFIENPLVEGQYYDVTDGINEDELSHFALISKMINEVSREEKAARKEKAAEFQAAKTGGPKDEWSEEVEKAFNDIMDKSRKSFHKLDDLAKKSFVVKYILHGLEAKRSKEDWGRVIKPGKPPKEIYADSLKSYKEKQRFVKDVLARMRQNELDKKEGEKKLAQMMSRFKSIPDLEMKLGQSSDGLVTKLAAWAKDKFGKGWYDENAYLEILFKIQAKQYNNQAELTSCVKQWDALEGNTKTVKSIDITTVCPKREKLLEMEAEWAKAEKDVQDAIEDGASESTISQLRKRAESLKITEANNPTCAYCYVETGREAAKDNPNYMYAKAEKRGQTYQDTFQKWIKTGKDGNPVVDKDGNFVLTKGGAKNREMFNKMGGLRFFSSGDYIEDEATDTQIERIIKDAEAVGLQLKAITKQDKFVKKYGSRKFEKGPLKGKPVFNINMSVDELLGFPLVVAKQLKRQYPGNVNIRVVARNPEEAIKYSKEKEVDVITLLHFNKRSKRMKNKDLYVDMTAGSEGWKRAMKGMKEAHPRENWNKIFSKICCQMDGKGDCRKCPNACGFNPRRVADYTQLAKGGKMALKN